MITLVLPDAHLTVSKRIWQCIVVHFRLNTRRASSMWPRRLGRRGALPRRPPANAANGATPRSLRLARRRSPAACGCWMCCLRRGEPETAESRRAPKRMSGPSKQTSHNFNTVSRSLLFRSGDAHVPLTGRSRAACVPLSCISSALSHKLPMPGPILT